MRRPTPILTLACFAWGLLALAFTGFARETSAPVHLVAPWAGATLAAGSTAELEWTPGERFAELQKVQEWEAFLSLDGGATYPVRITPHLDQDLRRIRFQVPPLPARDARILLRFGDEARETAVELPERFAIAASPGLLPALGKTLPLARSAFAPGEPALPGHAGVVAWVEGSRRGGGLRQVVAAEAPGLRSRFAPPETHGEAAVLASEPTPPESPGSVPETAAAPPAGRGAALSRAGTGPPLFHDILLLIQRRNE
jgi:hypothetical protein